MKTAEEKKLRPLKDFFFLLSSWNQYIKSEWHKIPSGKTPVKSSLLLGTILLWSEAGWKHPYASSTLFACEVCIGHKPREFRTYSHSK